jgi:hypothetical protein
MNWIVRESILAIYADNEFINNYTLSFSLILPRHTE